MLPCARLIVEFELSWAVAFRTSPRGVVGGGALLSHSWSGVFIFMHPAVLEEPVDPPPPPSTPQHEAGRVCWVETVDCLDE